MANGGETTRPGPGIWLPAPTITIIIALAVLLLGSVARSIYLDAQTNIKLQTIEQNQAEIVATQKQFAADIKEMDRRREDVLVGVVNTLAAIVSNDRKERK